MPNLGPGEVPPLERASAYGAHLANASGAILLVGLCWWLVTRIGLLWTLGVVSVILAASLPNWILLRQERNRLRQQLEQAEESRDKLKLQLDTVRFRTGRLREELLAANKQARLSHQLTLLGQFTAGFMHEFNNPLAIVEGRLDVLLDERKDDAALCADIEQMLKETRYMGQIAKTLLQALRRERGAEVFEASDPAKALSEAVKAMQPRAAEQGVRLLTELPEGPRADIPEHVVTEVVRGLLANAVKALEGRDQPCVWVGLTPYRSAGARIVVRVEDNGPGVPEGIRKHLFEPFVSHSAGREGLGLGLFLAASLLDMYDGTIRYEDREGGGAAFVIELPPARFTRDQPYHWFAGGATE